MAARDTRSERVDTAQALGDIQIAALALASGIGFTQVQGIFAAFPPIVQSIFGSNCIAVAFVVAVVANLLLPKEQADEE